MKALLRFEGTLQDHSSGGLREFTISGSVKDLIESFGVPHPEVGQILANGIPVSFHYLVQDNDDITVSPGLHLPPNELKFILDVHLGRLAAYLRMLGLDTFYRSCLDDPELAEISAVEDRILLTRDRGLLMRNRVTYGYWLRHTDSRLQVEEVIQHFRLTAAHLLPWTRCMACNGPLRPAPKATVLSRIPPRTAELHEDFSECLRCRRVFWKGSHYDRMARWVADLLPST